uniref:Uncharacterized protein n=1 Tax=Setaria viridis TaxID=4556 RepID=A0A4V6D4E4_SETVI|nr:hypothetical protein SEVIR_9G246060v2 [Setaria viridis]
MCSLILKSFQCSSDFFWFVVVSFLGNLQT